MKMTVRGFTVLTIAVLLMITNNAMGGVQEIEQPQGTEQLQWSEPAQGIVAKGPIGENPSIVFLVSMICQQRDIDINDWYNSVVPTEVWLASHGLSSMLFGFVLKTVFIIGNPTELGVSISHLTGEPDGTFSCEEVSPTQEGPYSGKVEYDYDQWDIAVNFNLTKSLYTRLEYSTWEMEGSWVYTSVVTPDEAQKYKFDSYNVGLGFKHDLIANQRNDDSEGKFGLVLDLFAACTFFNLEHIEKTANLSYETDGIGYKLSSDLLATYDLGLVGVSKLFAFAGGGYDYENSDEDHLDMTQDGFSGKIGLEIRF